MYHKKEWSGVKSPPLRGSRADVSHFHLVIETPDANLVAVMRWLQSTYNPA